MARKKEQVADVDYPSISAVKDAFLKTSMIMEAIEKVKVPCLTDAITWRSHGGQDMLKFLDAKKHDGSMKWTLNVLLMPNGAKPKPGDKISFVSNRSNRDPISKKKMSTSDVNEMVRRFGKNKLETISEYTVNDKLQIECGYMDAMHLLTQYGMHYDAKRGPISKLPETSNGGKIFNWRFSEHVEFEEEEGVKNVRK